MYNNNYNSHACHVLKKKNRAKGIRWNNECWRMWWWPQLFKNQCINLYLILSIGRPFYWIDINKILKIILVIVTCLVSKTKNKRCNPTFYLTTSQFDRLRILQKCIRIIWYRTINDPNNYGLFVLATRSFSYKMQLCTVTKQRIEGLCLLR